MVVYMKVTMDEYELPIYITETVSELAEKCGVTEVCIRSAISHEKAGRKKSCYKKVEVEDDE